MQLKDSKTYLNLAKSYAGECQAQVRYKFIEYGARMEGYTCLAELVDKVVYNEFNHARMFYTELQKASSEQINNIEVCAGYPFKQKWDLQENLRLASEDEHEEYTKIYPEFKKIALEEGFEDIARLYDMIIQVESCHYKMFNDLYTQMKSGTLYKKEKPVLWKCAGCGYEATSKSAWEVCPLCKAKQGFVMLKLSSGESE